MIENVDNLTHIVLIIGILTGILTSYLAEQRGRNLYFWFAIGFIFGLLGTLVLFLLPKVTNQDPAIQERDSVETPIEAPHEFPKEYQVQDWYYLNSKGQQIGPVCFDEIQRQHHCGHIDTNTYLWTSGWKEWVPLHTRPELQQHL